MTNYLVRMPQQLKSSCSDYTSKIKKLAQKALTSPSILSTAETRELGACVLACITSKMRAHPRGCKATKKAPTKKRYNGGDKDHRRLGKEDHRGQEDEKPTLPKYGV